MVPDVLKLFSYPFMIISIFMNIDSFWYSVLNMKYDLDPCREKNLNDNQDKILLIFTVAIPDTQ